MEKDERIKGGKADGLTPKDIADKHGVSIESINKEINIGYKIEREHTTNKDEQLEIILDHLFEFPDYYSNKRYGLIKMEKNLEKDSNKDKVEESTKLIKLSLREGLKIREII